jgi:plasmid replication initiation protein
MDVNQPLVPLRHPNRDFFVLDITDAAPRGDMPGMEFPFFALGTQPDTREREYRRGDTILKVIPSVRGMATVFDRDILLYCISQLVARKNAGLEIGKVVRFNAHDMMVATNRQTDGHSYARLKDALVRLRGTTFETTIKTGGKSETEIFGIVEKAYAVREEPVTGRMIAVEVVLSEFLLRAIESDQVLAINRVYFQLRSPVDRRLYELARKHCGQQPQWSIGLELLKDKVAFSSNARKLRAHVRGLSASQHLPDYTVEIVDDVVTFRPKPDESPSPALPSAPPSVEAAPTSAPTPAEGPRRIMISSGALERARELAPGWDKYYLEGAYKDFFADKEPAKNEDARFLAWVPSFVRGRKP